MEEYFIQSFKGKVESRGRRGNAPDSLPTIISTSNAVNGRGQRNKRPRYVSIGPLHHGDPVLQDMENHKWWLIYMSDFGSLSYTDLSICFSGLKDLEERSRKTYSTNVDMTREEFVEMLFLDACFIILRVINGKPQTIETPTDPSSSRARLLPDHPRQPQYLYNTQQIQITERVERLRLFDFDEMTLKYIDIDLITLGNQIPFFIIEHIWKWLRETALLELSLDPIGHLRTYFEVPVRSDIPNKVHHLLHLLHCSIVVRPHEIRRQNGRKHWIPCATELKEAGINFRFKEYPDSFLDVEFENGVIEIPKIFITERQRLRLQNLVDLEQSVSGIQPHFTSFVRFMSCLLSKEEDVRIISLQGIIENQLGSDKEVQKFFQNLMQRCDNFHENTFLDDVFIKINDYQQSKRKRWKASFRRRYCSNPWITISVMGAIILFILTFLQTFFTVYPYFYPPS